MADGVFNIAKGRVNEYVRRVVNNDPAASELNIMLLKALGETEDNLIDKDDFAAILAVVGTDLADFTNYTDKQLDQTDADIGVTVNDGATNNQEADFSDQTWTAAGNGTNNNLVKLIVGYDPLGTGVAANIIPLCHFDFTVTTDGSDITAVLNASGFFRAS